MSCLKSLFAVVLVVFCLTCIALANSDDDGQKQGNPKSLLNYITTTFLPDGESEIRMRFGDVIVREASITKENQVGVKTGLMLRQLASGPNLLKMIYKVTEGGGRVSERKFMALECEITNDWDAADQFRNHFREDLRRAGVNLDVPPNHLDFLLSQNVESTVNKMESLDKKGISEEVFDMDYDRGLDEARNVSVKALRNDEVIGDLQHSFDMKTQKTQCRRLIRKLRKAASHHNIVTEDSTTGFEDEDSDSRRHKLSKRFRRAAFHGIMPGTLWCGDGSMADRYEDIGAHVGTDSCCREHDLGCPYFIPGMTSKYGLFNFRLHTLSHCICDEKFSSCLKQTNTGSSNFVGRLFFNLIQTKCFVLKPEKYCSQRRSSWWGPEKCVEFKYRKQAQLQDPRPY